MEDQCTISLSAKKCPEHINKICSQAGQAELFIRKTGSFPCVHRVGSLRPDTAQRLRVIGTRMRFHMEHILRIALKCLTSQMTPGFMATSLCNDGSPLCLQVESFPNHSALPTTPKTALYTGVPYDPSQRPPITFYACPPPPGSHVDSMVLNVK